MYWAFFPNKESGISNFIMILYIHFTHIKILRVTFFITTWGNPSSNDMMESIHCFQFSSIFSLNNYVLTYSMNNKYKYLIDDKALCIVKSRRWFSKTYKQFLILNCTIYKIFYFKKWFLLKREVLLEGFFWYKISL